MNERLNLQDLIDLLAKRKEITKKDAETFLRELVAVVSENIENNESVKIKDLGTFKLVKVSPRKSVDVNTGEAIEIPAHYKLSFNPEKSLKEAINRPFSHFESVILEEGVSFDDVEKVEEAGISYDIQQEDNNAVNEPEEPLAIYQAIKEMASEEIQSPLSKKEVVEEEIAVPILEDVIEETSEDTPAALQPSIEPTEQVSSEEEVETEVTEALQETGQRKRRRRLITLGFFIFIIIAGFAICALFFQQIADYLTNGPSEKEPQELVENKEQPEQTKALAADSLSGTTAIDSSATTIKEETVDINQPLGITSIKRGDTMRNIALEHYGHKSFWIYIYEENKDVIKNPNNVPLGTKLVLPNPAKYKIDSKDKESIDRAKTAESKLIASLGL